MTETILMAARHRDRSGKGAARATRRDGFVPAIIYGNKEDPQSIAVELAALARQCRRQSFFSRVCELDFGSEKLHVLAREVQKDPVSGRPLHVDFLRFGETMRVTVDVALKFENSDQSPGIKFGGVLNVVSRSVQLICRPNQIPSVVVVDLTGLEVGDVIHGHGLKIPSGAELAPTARDETIATITPPAGGKGGAAAAG